MGMTAFYHITTGSPNSPCTLNSGSVVSDSIKVMDRCVGRVVAQNWMNVETVDTADNKVILGFNAMSKNKIPAYYV